MNKNITKGNVSHRMRGCISCEINRRRYRSSEGGLQGTPPLVTGSLTLKIRVYWCVTQGGFLQKAPLQPPKNLEKVF